MMTHLVGNRMLLANQTLGTAFFLPTIGSASTDTPMQQMFIRYTRYPRRSPCPNQDRLLCWQRGGRPLAGSAFDRRRHARNGGIR